MSGIYIVWLSNIPRSRHSHGG